MPLCNCHNCPLSLPLEATFRSKLLYLSYPYKRDNCSRKDMLYYENLAPLVRSYPSVHRVLLVFIHSSYSILISEFYPPISSPSFLSTFIHLKIRSTSEDINWSWSNLKASTSRPQGIILYLLKPWIIVQI